jgi:hypothetical protein
MARLGELLVATKLLTPEQVEQGLRAQVMWGGRLGTNLIELGFLDLDQLSTALGKQHRLPAALARHFDKADPALQRKLSSEFADRYATVPLMRVASGKVVVAALGIVDARGVGIMADELESDPTQLVISVAAELRIRYHLERAYGIPRGARFLRSRGKTIPPFPAFVTEELDFEDSAVSTPMPTEQRSALAELHAAALTAEAAAALSPERPPTPLPVQDAPPLPLVPEAETLEEHGAPDDLTTGQEPTDEKAQRDRRTYVRMITDQPSTESERAKLGRIAIRRVAVTTSPTQTLGEATRAIRRSTDRDKVAELVLLTLEKFVPSLEAAVMLVLRGDVAIGWKGFCKAHSALPEVAIPLEQPGLIPTAIALGATVRAAAPDLGSIDQLLLFTLGATGEKELIVVPVMIAGQTMLTIALVVPVETPTQSTESIAVATGAAFSRLMRDASR